MGRAIKLFIMIFYFSGTGNSLWVARQLQESLQEPLYKLVDVLSSDQVYACLLYTSDAADDNVRV